MHFCRAVILLLLASAASCVYAGEFGANIYGLSYHFERGRARELGLENQFNPGLGVRYLIGENDRFRWFADGGLYYDSSRHLAKLGGIAAQWKATESLGLGGALVVWNSRSYNEGRTFVAPLPVVSYEIRWATLNLFYAPKVSSYNEVNTLGFWVTVWPGRW
ncbi:MAG: hypothetical protein ACXW2A_11765 [Burkholderiales bacterium]